MQWRPQHMEAAERDVKKKTSFLHHYVFKTGQRWSVNTESARLTALDAQKLWEKGLCLDKWIFY